MRNTRQTVYIL